MRLALCAFTLILAAGSASRPVVTRAMVAAVEKNFDRKVVEDVLEDPYLLLGMTRGVYLPGYGAIFTMEVNLAHGASFGPFGAAVRPEHLARVNKRKQELTPRLKQSMREMLVSAAGSLDTVPLEEKIVLGVSLAYHRVEDRTGLPQQIVMAAPRKTLIDFQTNRRPASALESAIEVQELAN